MDENEGLHIVVLDSKYYIEDVFGDFRDVPESFQLKEGEVVVVEIGGEVDPGKAFVF